MQTVTTSEFDLRGPVAPITLSLCGKPIWQSGVKGEMLLLPNV